MGRAIVRDPQVFLFDEPLSNLDAKLRVQMRAEIKELHQRLRTTTVFVTHDQIEAMTMADKIVVMNAGRIEQVGAPLELYDRPINLFVAEFIGSPAMNLLRGVVRGGGVAVQERVLPVAARGLAEGRAVVYGIRPEHLELARGRDRGAGRRGRADRGRDARLPALRRAGAGGGVPRPARPRAGAGGADPARAPTGRISSTPRQERGSDERAGGARLRRFQYARHGADGDARGQRAAPAGGALAGGAGRRARRRLAGGRGGAAGADHGLSRSGLGGAQERPGAVAGGAGEPPADRRGGADARHQRSQAPFPGPGGGDRRVRSRRSCT